MKTRILSFCAAAVTLFSLTACSEAYSRTTAIQATNPTQQTVAADSVSTKSLQIIASSEMLENADILTKFLEKKNISYTHIDPSNQSDFSLNSEPTILFVATSDNGPAKGAAEKILNSDEMSWISETGNNGIYSKSGPEGDKPFIMVIGGSHPGVATDALIYNKNQWITELATALNIELTSRELYSY